MNLKLLQLLLDNRRPDGKARSRVEAAAKDGDETTIYLYDPIVGSRLLADLFGYVCAQDMVPTIDGLKSGTLSLRINCPGGDVFAMQAIMNALRAASERGVRLVAQVDGVAASAATGIASVCDEVVMGQGTQYMIHNSQGMAIGDRNELRALADVMEKVDGGLLDAYKAKSGKGEDQIRAWMDAETWFNAEDAVKNGFADRVHASAKKVKAAADWKLDAFANAPKPEPEPDPEPEIHYINDDHRARQQQRLRLAAATVSR
jgi:ATP-dependent Clp protease protease subunit